VHVLQVFGSIRESLTGVPMRLPLLAIVASALLAASAHAQQNHGAAPSSPAAAARREAPALLTRGDTTQAFKEMASSLRNLTIAQEQHYAEHGTYTTDAKALGTFRKNDRAYAQVIFAGGRSWTAMATFRGLRGKSCVAFVGDADDVVKMPKTQADGRTPKPSQEGQPICDTP
jgi:hypothetical protein